MDKFDTWVVAAAILANGDEYQSELHYRTLSDRVIDSGLTTLGLKGETPWQSLGSILRDHYDIFDSRTRGFYFLKNREKTAKNIEVERAIQALHLIQEDKQKAGELDSLRLEVRQLRHRNAILERKMAEIAEICNPFIDSQVSSGGAD